SGQYEGLPHIFNEVLRSSGQPLDARTRTFLEPSFGHDLSKVRMHTDDRAGASAQAVNALAYTVGNDLVFAGGQYFPGTAKGTRLIAHELTHVVQQAWGGTGMQGNLTIGQPHNSYEQEADRIAEAIVGTGTTGGGQSAGSPAGNQSQRSGARCEGAGH